MLECKGYKSSAMRDHKQISFKCNQAGCNRFEFNGTHRFHQSYLRKQGYKLIRMPVLGRLLLNAYRAKIAFQYCSGPLLRVFLWLFNSKETTNFTYHLEEINKRYLVSLISHITNKDFVRVMGYVDEVMEDQQLRNHIEEMSKRSVDSFTADGEARFGRRVGWYAFTRATKPKIVVETGVDKGLGACVITAALMKNSEEGYKGYYYGTDINPRAGYLLSAPYSNFGEILYGDSIQSLRGLQETIDIFINDSDHSAEYEEREYETVKAKLTPNAIILGDNAHTNDKLLNFALATGRHFVFFRKSH
jgi:hypothetical protein